MDEVIALDSCSVTATRSVPLNEPWTASHMPGNPIVPGVLLLEGLAQTAAILARARSDHPLRNGRLALVRSARFLREVRPGSTCTFRARLRSTVANLLYFDGAVEVNELLVAEASLALSFARDDAVGADGDG